MKANRRYGAFRAIEAARQTSGFRAVVWLPRRATTGVRSNHTVILAAISSAKVYPDSSGRVSYFDVETGRWIAVSVYVLVAIVRKRLGLEASLYQNLQILSVMLFEKTPTLQALPPPAAQADILSSANRPSL